MKSLSINGEVARITNDNKFYILDYDYNILRQVNKKEFINFLKDISWVCLTTWSKDLQKKYIEFVNYTNNLK